ncbi:M23 family metallopeptidase [Priestia flexa]|uniref:M23 family metallopeptidase n=1 Tax=Priestia flexa TaxID=86664 RepID=A0A8I1MH51_9BACI|nr:M23 family metallopeptidase [Priestia flexa]MBN8252187.1 M23 family metallopeptidase [Priestia flexa]UZW65239.1 M23 family metallopeptidase [Priestia flexa]
MKQKHIKTKFQIEEFAEVFLAGEFAIIYHQLSEEFQLEVPFTDFLHMSEEFNEGVEKYSLETLLSISSSVQQYIWIDSKERKGISLFVEENGTIVGLELQLIEQQANICKTSRTYRMPINQEWFVLWGGTNALLNYHYLIISQRYAYDLVIHRDESTYKEYGDELEDYYAFNQKVVAPAEGKVVSVVDGLKDNPIGDVDTEHPAGNYVIIDHGNSEYSLLAHFKQGSILVKEGDLVYEGKWIGSCGNSGNSTEPHIHFQVMNGHNLFTSESLQIQFKNGMEPIRGDYVIPTFS